ncbi:hypothetical protein L484_014145 [Morus notabilis]|uniref:Uncharacterized protein n=1 Tax=Morus notabilis TaxID=981085 RepID=W9R969_9ROSA|nr:hypothetical protein L484_014145 [Morus notabilis]
MQVTKQKQNLQKENNKKTNLKFCFERGGRGGGSGSAGTAAGDGNKREGIGIERKKGQREKGEREWKRERKLRAAGAAAVRGRRGRES